MSAANPGYEPTEEQISYMATRIMGVRNDTREHLSQPYCAAHPEISESDRERYRWERADLSRALLACLNESFYECVGTERSLLELALGTGDLHVMRAALRFCLRYEAYHWLCGEYGDETPQAEADAQFEIDRKRANWPDVHHTQLPEQAARKGAA